MDVLPGRDIDAVMAELSAIIDRAVENGERIGYFAALYGRVTSNVRRAILAGRTFEDNARMDRLDVVFADRFLDAWKAYKLEQPLTRSWKRVFRALDEHEVLVIQHLLMGMTAHIRLDLGVATAAVAGTPQGLAALRKDFLTINDVLGRLVGVVEAQVQTFSPRLGQIAQIAPNLQGRLFDFGLEGARDEAWELARRLVHTRPPERHALIEAADEAVADQIRALRLLKPVAEPVVRWINEAERKNVRFNVQVLAS